MEKPKIGVFIGRLQPVHNAHLAAIKMALSEVDLLVVVLGSACQAKTVKNPWTTEERKAMLFACLTKEEQDKVSVIPAKDYLYNDNIWVTALQSYLSTVRVGPELIEYDIDDCDVKLYGHNKDKSTFYLRLFPKWTFVETGSLGDIDATRVREYFFRKDTLDIKQVVPEPVFQILKNEIGTPEYERLYDEFQHISDYRSEWKGAPYPPTFVTTDAVLVKSGHVLVVRRRGQPGKGLIALPGGFIREDERIEDSCLRELKEETRIALPKDEMKKRIVDRRVFDHPNRSLRGRTVTHAFYFDLGGGELPKVKGDDDAEYAFWMPLRDVLRKEEEFFEDHFHIISYFVGLK